MGSIWKNNSRECSLQMLTFVVTHNQVGVQLASLPPASVLQHTPAKMAFWRDLYLTARTLILRWACLMMDDRDGKLSVLPVPTLQSLLHLACFASVSQCCKSDNITMLVINHQPTSLSLRIHSEMWSFNCNRLFKSLIWYRSPLHAEENKGW
jgi:hypothetical protein